MSVEEVKKAAAWTRPRTLGRTAASGDQELDDKVWAKTKEEITAGWLLGPYTEDEYIARVGPCGTVARRFGIWQKGDVRVIDDLQDPYVNS